MSVNADNVCQRPPELAFISHHIRLDSQDLLMANVETGPPPEGSVRTWRGGWRREGGTQQSGSRHSERGADGGGTRPLPESDWTVSASGGQLQVQRLVHGQHGCGCLFDVPEGGESETAAINSDQLKYNILGAFIT